MYPVSDAKSTDARGQNALARVGVRGSSIVNAPGTTGARTTEAASAHELARRLIARVARSNTRQSGTASPVFAVCQATYRVLARSIGAAGAEALLSRALALADKEHPLLREIPFDHDEDSALAGFKATLEKHGSPATTAALEKLLELILSLLERFVGIDMVVRLVAQGATIGTNEDEDAQ